MLPITCNAFGDIIAVVQLFRSVALALNETSGASRQYEEFVHELNRTANVMDEASIAAERFRDSTLRQTILEEVRLCCLDLERASKHIEGFDALTAAPSDSDRAHDARTRLVSRPAKMLRWHFTKASEAAEFARCFRNRQRQIHVCVTLLQMQEQRATASRVLGRLHGVDQTIMRQTRLISRHSSAVWQSSRLSTQDDTCSRFFGVAFPICVSWIALFLYNHDRPASVEIRWQGYTPWLALCLVVVHSVWMQANPISKAIEYGGGNAIIFVDFVGNRMYLPQQLCGTIEDFCAFIDFMFKKDRRQGWTFVQKRRYQILDLTDPSSLFSLTKATWSSHVTLGVEIQLGALLQRRVTGWADIVMCPFCGAETLSGGTDMNQGNWHSCLGCGQSFQSSTIKDFINGRQDSATPVFPNKLLVDPLISSIVSHPFLSSEQSTLDDESAEDLRGFEHVHIVRSKIRTSDTWSHSRAVFFESLFRDSRGGYV
ncbi:hypothetical protein PENSPDRAFT_737273 [Peniophora sp. CONT]|nr:hypothetical protein PENSPDRAFT_737273 [Peniophora sp. CONT]